jgi:chromosome segregation ATPase
VNDYCEQCAEFEDTIDQLQRRIESLEQDRERQSAVVSAAQAAHDNITAALDTLERAL